MNAPTSLTSKRNECKKEQSIFLVRFSMQALAKFAWILVLVIFFVGEGIAYIIAIGIVSMLILNWINPKWFDP